MNFKDRLIRKLLEFGKKHRLMVYPTLALVALISAVSHMIYWGKGNGRRLAASVMVVALLITQSLFLTSSAAGEDDLTTDETATGGDAAYGQDTDYDLMTYSMDDVAVEELSVLTSSDDGFAVQYWLVDGNVTKKVGSTVTYKYDESGADCTVPLLTDEQKAYNAFGSSEQTSYFKFTDFYTDSSCSGEPLSGNIVIAKDDTRINNGVLNLYYQATRTAYALAVRSDDNTEVIRTITIDSPITGDIDPAVMYDVKNAAEYDAYKTGYEFAGVSYNGASYNIGSTISIAPAGYVDYIVLNINYTALKGGVTFNSMASAAENSEKGITGNAQKIRTYTYDEDIVMPDSSMDGNASSEGYYIKSWKIIGTDGKSEEIAPGSTISSSKLFSANADKSASPNITANRVEAVWAYKEITLQTSDSGIIADENGASVSTIYGDDLNVGLNAVYKNGDDGSRFGYSISSDDVNKLAAYGLTYSTGATSGSKAGVVFGTANYVSDVTPDEGVTITLTVTDENKPGDSYEFPVTIFISPRTIELDSASVKSSNDKDAPFKQYDGLTNIDVSDNQAGLIGVLSSDEGYVSVSFDGSAELDDANAGSGKTITLSNVALNGDSAYKYVLKDMSAGSLKVEGIGTVEKRTLNIEMELADGESESIRFGEATPDYVLKLTDDSVSKLSASDYATYSAMDSTEFIRQYIGFTGFKTARTEYSSPAAYDISPSIDSTGKNYTVDASGLSKSFTVSRDSGTTEYDLIGTINGGYYNGLTIVPANGYTKIRRLATGEGDISQGTPSSTVQGLGWSSSISIEDMTNGSISFQMMSESGAITSIVTLNDVNVDTKAPVLEKIEVSPTGIKDYIKEFKFGSYYHSTNGIEYVTITAYYTSKESACNKLYYYFLDENNSSGAVTNVTFNAADRVGGYYVVSFNIGTSVDQRGQLVIYADNYAGNLSAKSKVKLDDFASLDTDITYYEWMIENNIEDADIAVKDAEGNTAVVSDPDNPVWYNGLLLSVDAADSESGVDKLTWTINTPDGVISPAPYENAGEHTASIVDKTNYSKIYEYIFSHTISGEDMPSGSYTISAVLEDNAGNTVTLDQVGPYNVDCSAPVIDVDAIADSDIYQSGIELSFDVTEGANESGIASVRLVRVDGSDEISVKSWTPGDSDETFAMVCEYKIVNSGTYRIIAADAAGNERSTERTFRKLSNTVPETPVISIDGNLGDNGWYKGEENPEVSIDCKALTSDNVKVTTYYKVTTDSSSSQFPLASNTEHYTFELEAQGEVTIEAWSVSEAGIESVHALKSIKSDTVKPSIEIINATVDDNGDMYINFRAKDTTSMVASDKVFLNGISIAVTEENNAAVGSFKAEGSKVYKLVVRDNAGNDSEEFTYQPLSLDVAPITNITTQGAYIEADITEGTYGISDYYIALKKHSDTSYRTCLFNEETTGNMISLSATLRGLDSDTVYDYRVYASNDKSEVKLYEGHFRTLSSKRMGSVYGNVTYADNIQNKEYPVYVSLYEANTVVASVRLDDADDTDYLFTNLPDGAYRVVATNGILTQTKAVTLSNGGVIYPETYAADGGIQLELNGYNTTVVIEDDAINITADQLEGIYDNSVYKGILTDSDIATLNNGGSINISLHASYIDVSDISSEEQSVFAAKLSDNMVIERYINLYVLKEVKNADGEYVNNTPVRISELYNPVTISFPLGELSGQKIYVASVHGEGSNYSFMNWSDADDIVITDNYVTITTRFFSVYALYRIVPSDKTYKVTWKDGDGNTMKVETVKEGESATPPDDIPVKTATEKYRYVFSGWDSDYSCVTSDMIIAARFTANLIDDTNNGGNSGKKEDTNNTGNSGTNTGDTTNKTGESGTAPVVTPNSYTYLGSAESPKTGDMTPVAAIVTLMLISCMGIVVCLKKRN